MFHTTTKQKLRNPRIVAADRKLATPLRKSTIEYWVQKIDNDPQDYEALMIKAHVPGYRNCRTSPELCSNIISDILDGNTTHTGKVWVNPSDVFRLIKRNLSVQHESINRSNRTTARPMLDDAFEDFLKKVSPTTAIYDLMIWAHQLSYVVERMAVCRKYPRKTMSVEESIKLDLKGQVFHDHDIQMKVMWTTQIVVIHYKGESWLLPKPSFLQLHNKICDLISVLVLAKMESGVSLEEDAYRLTVRFVRTLCYLMRRYGDKYFSISGSLEGLCTGEMLIRADDWNNDDLINVLSDDLERTMGFCYKESSLRALLLECSTPLIAELSCLSKIPGHPHIDMEGTLEKVHRRANEEIPINVAAVGFCTASIKESFVLNFIKRHHRWPHSALEAGVHPALREAWVKNITPNSPSIIGQYGAVETLEWHNITLGPELQYQYLDNMIPYLQDKVISVVRSKVVESFVSQKQIPMEEKRLLLHYLLNDEMSLDHRAFIDRYVDSPEGMGEVMDYLVVRLCPKEKEHKDLARMYGCMSYFKRCQMLSQEKTVMYCLDIYSDEQAMTLSEFRMVKKLQAFRHLHKAYGSMTIFMFNCDASGWCGKFRHAAVAPPMKHTLDQIFGKKIFSRTQEWYENTLFYADDPVHAQYWEGQRGGIEGLNQDTWVVLYTAQVKYAFKDTNYNIHVLCKGDDLRVAVAVPNVELEDVDKKAFVRGITQRISAALKQFGHDVKIQESYASEVFMSFSKQYSLGNIELSSQFRKIQKCYGSNNAILPTLEEYIGTSFANAHSSCYAGTTHYSSYVVALAWGYYYLLASRDPSFSKLPDDERVCLLLVPSCAGGFPMIFLHNMFVRAESDLLSSFVDLAFYCRDNHPGLWSVLKRVLTQEMVRCNTKKILVLDPYGLPLTRPQSAKSFLRRQIRMVLVSITKNESISQLLTRFDEDLKEKFIKILTSSTNEIQARIVNAIYSSSPFAHIDELVSRFDSSKSIWQLLIFGRRIKSASGLMRTAIKLDRRVGEWRYKLFNGDLRRTHADMDLDERCPMKFTQDWRKMCYGIKVVTVNNPPLGHYLSFCSPGVRPTTSHDQTNHFVYELTPALAKLSGPVSGEQYTAGAQSAFLGQKTSTGTEEPSLHIIEKNPVLSKLKQVLMLYNWCNVGNSNVPNLLTRVIQCYTSTPVEDLAPYQSRRRCGTATHHIRGSSFREAIVPNNRSNLYTRVKSESKTHVVFKGAAAHHNVNFLHIMCYSTCLLTLELQLSGRVTQHPLMWTVTNDCSHCNEPIEEEPIVLEDPDIEDIVLPQIKAMMIGQEAEQILRGELVKFNIAQEKMRPPAEGIQEYSVKEASTALVQAFLSEVFHHTEELQHRYRLHCTSQEVIEVFNNWSAGGSHKCVSLSELKKIDPVVLLDAMSPLVVGHCIKRFRNFSVSTLDMILQNEPVGSLPWSLGLAVLDRAGLLPGLIQAAADHYGRSPPMCFMNSDSSAKFLGSAMCHEYFRTDKYSFDVYYTSFEDTPRIRSRVLAMEVVFRKSMMTILLSQIPELEPCLSSKKHGEAEDQPNFPEWQMMVAQMVVLLLSPVNPDLATTVFHLGESLEIPLLVFENLTMDDLATIADPEWCYFGWFGHIIQSCKKNDLWETLTTLEQFHLDEAVGELQASMGDILIRATSVDIASCATVIRRRDLRPVYEEVFTLPEQMTDCPPISNLEGNNYHMALRVDQLLRPVAKEDPETGVHEGYTPFIDATYYTRWCGDGVSSLAKMAEMLFRCNINLANREGVAFTLGEGMGGISRFLLENSKTVVVFNSIETEDNNPAHPEIVLMDPSLRHRIFFVHTDRGLNDLTQDDTYEVIRSRYPAKSWLITCDAEIPPDDMSNIQVWLKVLCFYLRTRTDNGVLILKVYINHTKAVAQILTLARYYCLRVNLYRCASSHMGYEMYIIAQGTLKPFLIGDGKSLPIPHSTIHGRCIAAHRKLRSRCHLAHNYIYGLEPDELRFVQRYMPVYALSSGTLRAAMSTVLLLDQSLLGLLYPRHNPLDIVKLWDIEGLIHSSLSTLTYPTRGKSTSEHHSTLAHHYRIIEHAICLTSFLTQLKMGGTLQIVGFSELQHYFNKFCPLDPRYEITITRGEGHCVTFTHVESCPFYGDSSLRTGIEMALRLYGYLDYLQTR